MLANASDKLLEIESRRAKARMEHEGNTYGKITVGDKGEARDLVAKKLGISGKTLDTYRAARDIEMKQKFLLVQVTDMHR